MIKRIIFSWLMIVFINPFLSGQVTNREQWIDSLISTMSLEQKVGQLFMVRSFAKTSDSANAMVWEAIQKYHVGGVCFFKGTIPVLVENIKQYQAMAAIPLMMSMDAEWGLGMRMTDGEVFPKQQCLGAIRNPGLIYKMGREIGRQMKDLGLHMNFAPVVDVNNNLYNPVINERSFGSDQKRVSILAEAYMNGMQDEGVLACLKHFPGHGDTEVDSHKDLPVLSHSRGRLDSIELYPFKALCQKDPAAIMVGHLHIPVLDSTAQVPATLSAPITGRLLREELNFKGLIITDALEMEGVCKNFDDGQIALMAFKAGNDILLLSRNLSVAIDAIKQGILSGDIPLEELHKRLKRILKYKHLVGLNEHAELKWDSNWAWNAELRSDALRDQLYREAICLARDDRRIVPIRKIPKKIISIGVGGSSSESFTNRLNDFCVNKSIQINSTEQYTDSIEEEIMEADLLIVHIHQLNFRANRSYGLDMELLQCLNPIFKKKKCIVVLFGCPYVAMYFPQNVSLLLAHEDNELVQDLAAQLIFGTDPIQGVSPVDVSSVLYSGQGIRRPGLMRMGYSVPEAQQLNRDSLIRIDELAHLLICNKAAPGCQILVARNNKIVYNKSFGYLDYDSTSTVQKETLFDIASLTKVCCTAPVLYLLKDMNLLNFSKPLGDYIPEFKTSNKSDLTIRDIMLHQGRLVPWIPFYRSTLMVADTNSGPLIRYYDSIPSKEFGIPVCDNLYLRTDFRDSILRQIIESKRLDEKKFVYSDIGFYFIPALVTGLTKMPLEKFFTKYICQALELKNTHFNPLSKAYEKEQIAPSEEDDYWRMQKLQGYVHDMGAAMMGGICGHAGLFSNATEVARIMQLFLNAGYYAGNEILRSSNFVQFIARDSELGRRSFMFDMTDPSPEASPYISTRASERTFGHQGFTGTCVWIDPERQINYVFLSNRTYPKANHNLLHKERYRTKIQECIYQSLMQDGLQDLNH